ncbi:hypothetical protein JCM33374_g5611 [Metschnikowia sp. JCM 33374]|nr:hypothetical protein JCM33374_g5611 [Metschnikowia sp. JCM 33374]
MARAIPISTKTKLINTSKLAKVLKQTRGFGFNMRLLTCATLLMAIKPIAVKALALDVSQTTDPSDPSDPSDTTRHLSQSQYYAMLNGVFKNTTRSEGLWARGAPDSGFMGTLNIPKRIGRSQQLRWTLEKEGALSMDPAHFEKHPWTHFEKHPWTHFEKPPWAHFEKHPWAHLEKWTHRQESSNIDEAFQQNIPRKFNGLVEYLAFLNNSLSACYNGGTLDLECYDSFKTSTYMETKKLKVSYIPIESAKKVESLLNGIFSQLDTMKEDEALMCTSEAGQISQCLNYSFDTYSKEIEELYVLSQSFLSRVLFVRGSRAKYKFEGEKLTARLSLVQNVDSSRWLADQQLEYLEVTMKATCSLLTSTKELL